MTPEDFLLKKIFLPDLILDKVFKISSTHYHYHCHKKTEWEVCRKCPTKTFSVHDRRLVTVKHSKLGTKHIKFKILKRRFRCPNCKSVFTEIIDGIKPGFRTSERFRHQVFYDTTKFENLKSVASHNRCSQALVYKLCYERSEVELRKTKNTPWGKTVLIDEHGFNKNKKRSRKQMITALCDNNRKCLRELAPSVLEHDIVNAIKHIPGKENVTHAVIDMNNGFKNFALNYFPNAKIVIDKFHVIRLIHSSIRKYRKEVTGDNRKNPIRHLLLKNNERLKRHQRKAVQRFCRENSKVNEVYRFKERINKFYRIKGFKQASRIFAKITKDMAYSKIPEIQTLRSTLLRWRGEILQYFKTGLTNARAEGFNRKCKLIQRKAYGFKSFKNYRLRALYACS